MQRWWMGWLGLLLLVMSAGAVQAQQCTQAQLSTEFTSDPTARGYATCAATDDQCVLTRLNAPCLDAACKADQVVTREQFYAVIDKAELATLLGVSLNDTTAVGTRQRSLNVAMTNASFDLSVASVRQKLTDIFPAPSAPITNAAITALQQKQVPRSQIVCQRVATLDDVSCGRRSQACRFP